MTGTQPKTVSDVACVFCGCLCDDIQLTVQGGRIAEVRNACALGKARFLNHQIENRPVAFIKRKLAPMDEAVERAAAILSAARYPLVYGLSATTCEAQQAAVAFADQLGACIDVDTSAMDGPAMIALQAVGEVTCSLGEVKNRADLVIFWGVDPATTHPSFLSRYATMPAGHFLPNGRRDRTVIVVDVRPTATTADADLFLPIRPGKDFEALWALRQLVKEIEPAPEIGADVGMPLASLRRLAEKMKQCRFGVLFFGAGLAAPSGQHQNVQAALALVRDLNAHTRFHALALRGPGNAPGMENVLSWQTGYPFGVGFHRGHPIYNPGEFTAAELLARGEPDAALIVASDPMTELAPAGREYLAKIPYITLDSRETATARGAAVAFTTATFGIETAGTVYRMDGVSVPLRRAFDSPYPSSEELLRLIARRVRTRSDSPGHQRR